MANVTLTAEQLRIKNNLKSVVDELSANLSTRPNRYKDLSQDTIIFIEAATGKKASDLTAAEKKKLKAAVSASLKTATLTFKPNSKGKLVADTKGPKFLAGIGANGEIKANVDLNGNKIADDTNAMFAIVNMKKNGGGTGGGAGGVLRGEAAIAKVRTDLTAAGASATVLAQYNTAAAKIHLGNANLQTNVYENLKNLVLVDKDFGADQTAVDKYVEMAGTGRLNGKPIIHTDLSIFVTLANDPSHGTTKAIAAIEALIAAREINTPGEATHITEARAALVAAGASAAVINSFNEALTCIGKDKDAAVYTALKDLHLHDKAFEPSFTITDAFVEFAKNGKFNNQTAGIDDLNYLVTQYKNNQQDNITLNLVKDLVDLKAKGANAAAVNLFKDTVKAMPKKSTETYTALKDLMLASSPIDADLDVLEIFTTIANTGKLNGKTAGLDELKYLSTLVAAKQSNPSMIERILGNVIDMKTAGAGTAAIGQFKAGVAAVGLKSAEVYSSMKDLIMFNKINGVNRDAIDAYIDMAKTGQLAGKNITVGDLAFFANQYKGFNGDLTKTLTAVKAAIDARNFAS